MTTASNQLRVGLRAYVRYMHASQTGPLHETYDDLYAFHMEHYGALCDRYGTHRMRVKYARYIDRSLIFSIGGVTFRRAR